MNFDIPIVAEGKVIEDYSETHSGRFGESFRTPDPNKYFDNLIVNNRYKDMQPLYQLSLDEIVEYLVELGKRLDIETNPYLPNREGCRLRRVRKAESIYGRAEFIRLRWGWVHARPAAALEAPVAWGAGRLR